VAGPSFEIRTERREGGADIALSGRLDFREAHLLRRELDAAIDGSRDVRLDLGGVEAMDGGAAAVMAQAWNASRCDGRRVRFEGGAENVRSVLDLYTARALRDCERPAPGRIAVLDQIGRSTRELAATLRVVLEFLGESARAFAAAVRHPRTVNWPDVLRQMERAGADGLPIVLLIGFLIGLITAFQAAVQLRQLGADRYVADMVALAVTRELGPLMTAIVVAGRSGAAIAAEVGTMRVSEEVDALKTMGICPHRFLVFPRVLAVMLMLPVLTLMADAAGITGGVVIALSELDVSLVGYLEATRSRLDLWDVSGGLIKALAFGFIIAIVACERGLATTGGAEGVGRSTTSAVVSIIFHLILVDTLFAVAFDMFGI